MTRREMFSAAVLPFFSEVLRVPVRQVFDSRAKCTQEQLGRFSSSIWPEAIRDFRRCGIQLESTRVAGEVRRSPAGRPMFLGLEHGVINLVVTDSIPLDWDNGRGLTGVTTRYEGHHLCMIALNFAHGHQIPFFAVNTCVHELLHVLLHDIFQPRPKGLQGEGREFRVDLYATRLWLFHDGVMIRKAAQAYLDRFKTDKL